MVEDGAVLDHAGTRDRGPVDVAVLELLVGAAADEPLVGGGQAQRGVRGVERAVLLGDLALNPVSLSVGVHRDEAVLELLDLAAGGVDRRGDRVAQLAALPAEGTPLLEDRGRNLVGAGGRGPVDGAVLEVDVAADAVRGDLLAGFREAEPAGRAADVVVAGVDRAHEGVGTGVRGPVGDAAAEVLANAVLDGVLVVHAGADDAGLRGLGDRPDGDAVGAAVGLGQAQGVGDLRPRLGHLELPVGPGVDAGRAEVDGRLDPRGAGAVDEGLGGHAGEDLQADAGGVGGAGGHGVGFAEVIAAGTGGDVDLHVLERLDAQLRVVVDPALAAWRTPHGTAVVSAGVGLRGEDRLRHARRGGVQVAGEGADELEHVRVALREVHRGGAAHGQAEDGAFLAGAETVVEDGDQLLHEERLPLVVLAVVRLLPVRVEGGLAADGEDHVDVLVGVELLDVGLDGPAAVVLTGAEAVHGPHLREGAVLVQVPVAGEQHLHLDQLVRHCRGLDEQGDAAVGDPLDALDIDALRQPLDIRVLRGDGGALRRVGGADRIGEAAAGGDLGGGRRRHGDAEGHGRREDGGGEPGSAALRGTGCGVAHGICPCLLLEDVGAGGDGGRKGPPPSGGSPPPDNARIDARFRPDVSRRRNVC